MSNVKPQYLVAPSSKFLSEKEMQVHVSYDPPRRARDGAILNGETMWAKVTTFAWHAYEGAEFVAVLQNNAFCDDRLTAGKTILIRLAHPYAEIIGVAI